MNILVTNPGKRIYFIEFLIDLKKRYKNINIHVSDCSPSLPTMNIKKVKSHLISEVRSGKKKYRKKIYQIAKNNKINLILPLTDHDILILASLKNNLKKISCEVAVPNLELTRILHNKKHSFSFCKKNKILMPQLYGKSEIKNLRNNQYLVEKEITGSASKNIRFLKNNKKLKIKKNFIYQKYIKGTELHFDILNDFKGKYLASCVKKKIFMKNGETDAAKTLINKKFSNIAKEISLKLKHEGNLDCDAILDNKGKVFFIDFNPRFGGGYPFTHLSGINFLEILINILQKKRIKIYKPSSIKCFKSIGIFGVNEK